MKNLFKVVVLLVLALALTTGCVKKTVAVELPVGEVITETMLTEETKGILYRYYSQEDLQDYRISAVGEAYIANRGLALVATVDRILKPSTSTITVEELRQGQFGGETGEPELGGLVLDLKALDHTAYTITDVPDLEKIGLEALSAVILSVEEGVGGRDFILVLDVMEQAGKKYFVTFHPTNLSETNEVGITLLEAEETLKKLMPNHKGEVGIFINFAGI